MYEKYFLKILTTKIAQITACTVKLIVIAIKRDTRIWLSLAYYMQTVKLLNGWDNVLKVAFDNFAFTNFVISLLTSQCSSLLSVCSY